MGAINTSKSYFRSSRTPELAFNEVDVPYAATCRLFDSLGETEELGIEVYSSHYKLSTCFIIRVRESSMGYLGCLREESCLTPSMMLCPWKRDTPAVTIQSHPDVLSLGFHSLLP